MKALRPAGPGGIPDRGGGEHHRLVAKLGELVGSGDKIAGFTLPFAAMGVVLQIARPAVVAAPTVPAAARWIAVAALVSGVAIWLWSAILILTRVPRHELITTGPYAIVKHPLYTSVSLLVLPSLGLLLGTWLGAFIGAVMYVGSRRYAPEEERALSSTFGPAWDDYTRRVKLPWL